MRAREGYEVYDDRESRVTFRRAAKQALIPWLVFMSALVGLCLWAGLPNAVGWHETIRRFGLAFIVSYPATVLIIIRGSQLIEAAKSSRHR